MFGNNNQMLVKHTQGFGGNFIDSPYLSAAYETGKPYIFETALTKIFSSSSRFWNSKPLLSMTNTKYGVTEIDRDYFEWKLQGAEIKNASIVENLEAGNPTPGLLNTPFRIKLDLDYYANPDVLFGENNEYPLEIVAGPIADGTGYIYTVRIQGDNPNISLPVEELEVGRQFSKVWTTVQSELYFIGSLAA